MPLLSRGPEVFPRSLFELPSSDFPWLVAQTRSRQEKALARDLDPPGDVQASGAVKRHLAGVLLRRIARQLMEPPR